MSEEGENGMQTGITDQTLHASNCKEHDFLSQVDCSGLGTSHLNCHSAKNHDSGYVALAEDSMLQNQSVENCSVTTNCEAVSKNFMINKDSIPCISMDEQDEDLKDLGICAYDQAQFEVEVMEQVDQAIKDDDEKYRRSQIERDMKSVTEDIKCTEERLSHLEKALFLSSDANKHFTTTHFNEDRDIVLRKEKEDKLNHLKKLKSKLQMLNACATGNEEELNNYRTQQGQGDIDDDTHYYLQKAFASKESEEEKLIRLGQMTPFGTIASTQKHVLNKVPSQKVVSSTSELTGFDKFLLDQVKCQQERKKCSKSKSISQTKRQKICSSKDDSESANTSETNISQSYTPESVSPNTCYKKSPTQRKKIKLGTKYAPGMLKKIRRPKFLKNFGSDSEVSDFENGDQISGDEWHPSDEEYVPEQMLSDNDTWEGDNEDDSGSTIKKKSRQREKVPHVGISGGKQNKVKIHRKVADDGLQEAYVKRIKAYEKAKLLQKHKKILESEDGIVDSDDEDCAEFGGGYKVPTVLWNKLYGYQQTGVRWLWELHQQNTGGIVGDEMGLGKTIQVIVFLVGLKISNLLTDGDIHQGLGPVLLVCPTTVMHQWVKEFHTWWPPFRVAILHESGSFTGKKENLIATINHRNGILITSYIGLVQHQKHLLHYEWHYIILDEGHKIRNPDAQATLTAKQIRTSHRLILSGSPIQNNLKELWSLFDFIFPGKLGTLPIFMQQFSVPIVQGGYVNASQVQVQTAFKCATVLRDTIKPYLLRRMKADVKMSINLPSKNEQVLFCKLTEDQTDLYKRYIDSSEVQSIISGRLQVFVGLINLRKICNHPDLYTGGPKIFKDTDISSLASDMHYGYYKRAGKMIVVDALLRLWKKQGHRVLLFTQSRQMMEILEIFVKVKEYTYLKMDGSTSVSSRQPAVEKFNSDPSVFVFLLTTRVGGLGVNLIGANRIIIYDPDWNPSTDAQARERSWRIGQNKQVTIYRLLTAGTIEEKIYHRQIFKQFVTNRVLKDPRQRRFFKSNDLYELFTFTETGKQGTETSAIFAGTGSEVKPVMKSKASRHFHGKKKSFWSTPTEKDIKVSFSVTKVEKMKELAKKLSSQLVNQSSSSTSSVSHSQTTGNVKKSTESTNNLPTIQNNKTAYKKQNLIDGISSMSSDSLFLQPSEAKKNRKRKHKKTTVDGEEIQYLVKKDTYKSNDKEDESAKDDYVLSKLFKNSGVHTALKHDVIVDASDPDYMLVEGEANKIAQEAIKALKQSRRQCARAADGIPTWTGTNGGVRFVVKKKKLPAVSPSTSKSCIAASKGSASSIEKVVTEKSATNVSLPSEDTAPTSSSNLLAAIRQRKTLDANDDSDSDNHELPASRTSTEYDDILVDIRNFIAFRAATDGQATTEELLNEFKEKLPKQHTAVFKSLLNKICDFSRTCDGDGIWYLKEEFR